MKCSRCHCENQSTAKFCQECAAPLVRICRRCGGPLPDGAKFCPECAQPADEPSRGVETAHEKTARIPIPAHDGDRRQATVLFADIAGYTQLCSSMDAEHVQAMLNRFYTAMDGTVAAYGGSVIDHAGDGVLAVFGAPVAYGNDPERAVRAALEMHTAAGQIHNASGRPLRLHVGIASGEVVGAVLSGGAMPKYTVTGETVNLAARLDAQAGAGETVLSKSVYDNVSGLVDAEDLGELTVKGFELPIRVYRLRILRYGTADRLPFVGRLAELRQLAGVLDSTQETGRGVAVLIRGDPGIGKSRLVEELLRRAQAQGFLCHVGRILDFGVGKRQAALPAVVSALLGLPTHAPNSDRQAALDLGVETGRIEAAQEALIADLLDLDQREDLQPVFDAMDNATRLRRTSEAVGTLVAKAALDQPRMIVFEDIHWADSFLLGCLAAVTMSTQKVPLVLAMTTRFEGDPLDRSWRAASHGTPLLTIDIGPLRPEEALVMAGGVMETSNRFAMECIQRAEGNPLFLEQLLRNVKESEGANIPPTIQSLVLARMDRLRPADKFALQAASVIGKHFSLEGLRFLIGNEAYRCDVLVATDLIRPEAGDYLFAHALIQEGVYSSLLNSRKRELHAQAAQWYGTHEPTLYAEHLDRAQDPDAARAYLLAAQVEAHRFRFDTALRLVERGGELTPESQLRYEFAMLRGGLLREMARTGESIMAFEQALQSADGDGERRCRALIGVAAGYRVTGAMQEAMTALDEAQPIAERLESWSACSRIHSTRGNLYFAQGKVSACLGQHELALDYARRSGDPQCEALAWSGLGDHAYAEGRMATALRHFKRCVELCRQAGLVRDEIPNLCMIGHCLGWLGEAEQSLLEIRKALSLSNRIGLLQTEVMTLESLAFALVFQGHYAEAEPWAERATIAARQASARRYLAVNHMLMAACRRARDRLDEASELISEAMAISVQTGMGFLGPSLYAVRAGVEKDPTERRRWLREGEALMTTDCLAHARLMFFRDAITISIEDQSWDEALRYAQALEDFVRPEPMLFATLTVARARALVALARRGAESDVIAELMNLREELRRTGFGALTSGIDAALGSV
jgi:class 3 adenylate cyclase/tetratricopeptide (TPR) repeat protein